MKKTQPYLLFLLVTFLFSCQKDSKEILDQSYEDESGIMAETYYPKKSFSSEDLKIVSFNTHSATKSELEDFRDNYLSGDENVICLQEVSNIFTVLEVFKSGPNHRDEGAVDSYPYYQWIDNYTKLKWTMNGIFPTQTRERISIMILSKFPIVEQATKMVQKDPAVDEWARHAQYVRLKVNSNISIDLFNYHNTYNFGNNNHQWEKSGMESFKDWVEQKIRGTLSCGAQNVFLAGDFNLSFSSCKSILGTTLNYSNDWVDYVVSTNVSMSNKGYLNVPASLSDHDAVWAEFNLVANRNNALGKVVRLYEHSNFRGEVASFELGSYSKIVDVHPTTFSNFWNDRVSSVRVGGGLQLSAYEHNNYGGKVYYWPQINNSGTLSSRGMNDKISSLKVTVR